MSRATLRFIVAGVVGYALVIVVEAASIAMESFR